MTNAEIITTVTDFAPLSLQESWDNSGVQVGDINGECSGVMLCVDATEAVLDEAIKRGCSLIVSHHPLLFRGLKSITGANGVERVAIKAIQHGITIFSAHTSLDSTIGGISAEMCAMLGGRFIGPLSPAQGNDNVGLGAVCEFPEAITADEFVARVKSAFGSPICRCSSAKPEKIKNFALCGGAGGEFIPTAIASGAQAYLSSDIRYHDFLDHGHGIFIVDIGHYESESCAKEIFYRIICKKFPNFAVYKSEIESNPINYK